MAVGGSGRDKPGVRVRERSTRRHSLPDMMRQNARVEQDPLCEMGARRWLPVLVRRPDPRAA
eukprot:7361373-Prymnesium_polylepis.1